VWRHKARATFALNKNFSVSTAWRHFAGVDNDLESNDPLVGGGEGTSVDSGVAPRIKAQNYFDLALVGTVDKFTWRLGAQNVFDRQPPITPNYSNNGSNTFAQVYDSLGRYIYTSVTLDF
jgi:outer membrane receptor protein involved in Fe transport